MTPEQILTAQESATISLAPEEKQFSASPTPLARKSLLSPAGLITREMEILHPVAQGLTDAQPTNCATRLPKSECLTWG